MAEVEIYELIASATGPLKLITDSSAMVYADQPVSETPHHRAEQKSMTETEVTAEMIAAGLHELGRRGLIDRSATIEAIYRAMRALEPVPAMRIGSVVREGVLGHLMTVYALQKGVAFCVWSDGEDMREEAIVIEDLEVIR